MGTERFTIPLVKRSFLKRIFIYFFHEKTKDHFTIVKKENQFKLNLSLLSHKFLR